ncbi:MAG: phage portal protein [Brevundimonas sp.]|uniref:phage portal protein n=1 Tax=Brevundimonas sp. TaxID=1871086 RepID=UPI0012208195|nr:phage portal protein [Brevundimonas sp.]RZJ19115.1 MAG: phage portal protein [Brevundimonas sp.]
MSFFDRFRRGETRAASIENPTVPVSSKDFLAFFLGQGAVNLPPVTPDSAMTVPAVAAAVTFLSSALANLPLHLFKDKGEAGVERDRSDLSKVLNEAMNDEWSSFAARRYFWSQVFSAPGRGLLYIERAGPKILSLWPMDASTTVVQRVQGRRVYHYGGRAYPASDIIDVPFLLKSDQLSSHSPFVMASKAIQLALSLGDYASGFFAGGGVPPLALTGPMPSGADAVRRAQADIKRAIDAAKANNEPVFPIPAGYELKPVGFEPDKGQMTEARRFQVEEFSRVWGLPPVFLQDLTHGTFTNTEQQDLFLAKHLISAWAKALEDELNLKLFGPRRNRRYVEHNLGGLERGDLKSRMEALARGVQTAILTPDEARAYENRPPKRGGDQLYIQGATVPLGAQPQSGTPTPKEDGEAE